MIRTIKAALLFAWVAISVVSPAQSVTSYTLTNVNIVDVEAGKLLKNRSVVIDRGRIVQILPFSASTKGSTINGGGGYLIPGLMDTHLHLHFLVQNAQWNELHLNFKLMVANGITGLREASGNRFQAQLVAIRDSIDKGLFPAPKMYISGIGTPPNLARYKVQSYARLVDTFQKIGVDGIKIKGLTFREAKEVIDAAKRYSLPVYGHTAWAIRNETNNILGDYTSEIVDYGLSGVMHVSGYPPIGKNAVPPPPEAQDTDTSALWDKWWLYYDALWLYADTVAERRLINTLTRRNVWLEPTLFAESLSSAEDRLAKTAAAAYFLQPISALTDGMPNPKGKELDTARMVFTRKLRFVGKFYSAGGVLLAGTDGQLYGSDLRDELYYLVEAGLTPAAALKAATYNNARALGWLKELGTISKGKLASMVLLRENPLADIRNVEKIEAVFLNGRYYSKKAINAWKEEVRKAAEENRGKN